MILGKILGDAAQHPAEPTVSPPLRKSACSLSIENLSGASEAGKRVNLFHQCTSKPYLYNIRVFQSDVGDSLGTQIDAVANSWKTVYHHRQRRMLCDLVVKSHNNRVRGLISKACRRKDRNVISPGFMCVRDIF